MSGVDCNKAALYTRLRKSLPTSGKVDKAAFNTAVRGEFNKGEIDKLTGYFTKNAGHTDAAIGEVYDDIRNYSGSVFIPSLNPLQGAVIDWFNSSKVTQSDLKGLDNHIARLQQSCNGGSSTGDKCEDVRTAKMDKTNWESVGRDQRRQHCHNGLFKDDKYMTGIIAHEYDASNHTYTVQNGDTLFEAASAIKKKEGLTESVSQITNALAHANQQKYNQGRDMIKKGDQFTLAEIQASLKTTGGGVPA